jgi:hypothetical protein
MVHPVPIVGGGPSGRMSASSLGTVRHFVDFPGPDRTTWTPAASGSSGLGNRIEKRRGDGTRPCHPSARLRGSDGFHRADGRPRLGYESRSLDERCSRTAEAVGRVKALPSTREYLTSLRDRQDRAPGSAPAP